MRSKRQKQLSQREADYWRRWRRARRQEALNLLRLLHLRNEILASGSVTKKSAEPLEAF